MRIRLSFPVGLSKPSSSRFERIEFCRTGFRDLCWDIVALAEYALMRQPLVLSLRPREANAMLGAFPE